MSSYGGITMDYFKNIEELIIENEATKKVNALKDNSNTLNTYWNIGKLIVEAQGGEKRAKYGDNLISEWGKELSSKYGKIMVKATSIKCEDFTLNFQLWTHCVHN